MIYFISTILCGLGLFLLGMRLLTNGLQTLSSNKLRSKLQRKLHPLLGILIGAIITMLIQSSSGTTIILIGLAEANLFTLLEIVPMIMGANIGTTITAQLIAFDLFIFAPMVLMLGLIMLTTTKKHKFRCLGEALVGFSLIFIGIDFLSKGLAPLQGVIRFQEILKELADKPFLGILMGLFTTAIIQSSSTGIAILQSMAAGGSISIASALPILLGQNIGTCATTLIASLQLSTKGKQAAMLHLFFNLFGVILLFPFIPYLSLLSTLLAPNNVSRQIAHSHSLFNIIATIFLLPLAPLLVKLTRFLIKDQG